MPVGYLVTVVIDAVCVAAAVRPPMPAHSSPSNLAFWLGFLVNELPFLALYWLVWWTAQEVIDGDIRTPVGAAGAVMAAAAVAGLVVIVRRALAARDVLDAAVSTLAPTGAPRRRPWRRILLWPFPTLPRDVERIGNLRYDDASRAQRLDLYRPRGRPPDGPTLVYLHGGTFRGGNKRREARPLLHRLARHGWVCVSADYRRAPYASYRDQLIDTKRVIAWVRELGARYGLRFFERLLIETWACSMRYQLRYFAFEIIDPLRQLCEFVLQFKREFCACGRYRVRRQSGLLRRRSAGVEPVHLGEHLAVPQPVAVTPDITSNRARLFEHEATRDHVNEKFAVVTYDEQGSAVFRETLLENFERLYIKIIRRFVKNE
jgi:hypothetical protein